MKNNDDCNNVDRLSLSNPYTNTPNKIDLNQKINKDAEERLEENTKENKLNNSETEKLLVSKVPNSAKNSRKNSLVSNEEESKDPLKSTLDCYIDKIGFNSFQLITIFIVCYVFFVDGSEMVIINLTLSSIQRDWKISMVERSLLSSAVFFGFFFGSLISGYLSNKFGRKNPCVYCVFLIWIFSLLTPLVESFSHLFAIRIFVGLGIGVLVPALSSLITELIPTYNRSFVLNMLWILYPVGIVYICCISIFYIKDKLFLDWKNIALINSYSSGLMAFMIFFLPESPRYLLLKRKYKEAFEILDKLGKPNNIFLTEDQKEKIILEYQLLEESNKTTSDFDVSIFVTKRYLKVSFLLAYLWFIKSLISYGLLYILPKIFDSMSKDKKSSLMSMIYSMLILIGCPIFRGLISEVQSLGRKKSMILGLFGALISCSLCLLSTKYISITSGLLKFFINSSLGIVSVYTSEVYPTNARGIALGFGNSITRLGGIVTPFICEIVEGLVPKGPFWLFVIGSITGMIACVSLPFETMGMSLDQIPTDSKNAEEEKNIDTGNMKGKV